VTGREVGRVAALWRYPVKSMAPEALERAEVDWHGIAGDRRWAFVRADQERNGFPWLTIRESPVLARHQPRLVDPTDPDESAVRVRTPAGVELDVADPALAAELGAGVRVMKLDRGAFDTLPLALISRQTLADLGALVGHELAAQRFRPNLLIDGAGGTAYPEDSWVGATLRVGELQMRIDKRDQRCLVVNLDPATGARDPAILRAIGRERQACLGVYGSVVTPGAIGVGDPVMLDA
jgi:MOSC domain-containing protein